MNSKEIELILKARLEASDAEKDAVSVASKIGGAIEQAFNGLGSKIADRFADEFKQKIAQLDIFSFNNVNSGYSRGPALPGATHDPGQLQLGQQNAHLQQPITSHTNEQRVRSGAFSAGSAMPVPGYMPASRRGYGTATLLASQLPGMTGGRDLMEGFGLDEAKSMDDKLSRFKYLQQMRSFNPSASAESVGLSNKELVDLKKEVTALGSAAGQRLATGNFDQRIDKLTQALDKLSVSYEKAISTPADQRSASERMIIEKYESAAGKTDALRQTKADLEGTIKDLGSQAKDLPTAAVPWYRDRMRMGQGAVAAGEMMGFMGNANYSMLRGEMGAAQVAGMGTRDYMDKNWGGMLAAQFGGGYQGLQDKARFSAGMDIGGGLVSGVGQMVIGGATAKTGIGALVGINGIRQTMSSAKDMMEYESAVFNKMGMEQNLQYGKNKEFIDMYVKGRANQQGSYNEALGMGSEMYSNFLTGGGKGGVYDRSRQSGLSMESMRGSLRQYTAGMGGVYMGYNTMEDPLFQDAAVRGNFAKGKGFANVEDVSSAMFRGGSMGMSPATDRARAIDESIGRYDSYRGAGLEEGGSVQLLGSMAARANSGLDMSASAGYNADVAANFGANNGMRNSNQLQFLNRTQNNMTDATNTGQGMMGIAKIRAVKDLEKRLGRKLTKEERYQVQLGTMGEESMARIMGLDPAKKGDLEKVRSELGSWNQSLKKHGVDMYTQAVGGDRKLGAMIYGREQGGANTGEEMYQASQLATQEDGKPKEVLPGMDFTRGQKMPTGKREQIQETGTEIDVLMNGIRTLNEGFNALETSAKDAAKRLDQLAGNPIATAAEQEAMRSESAKRDLQFGDNATGTMLNAIPGVGIINAGRAAARQKGWISPRTDVEEEFKTKNHDRGNKAQAPRPGGN